MYHCIPFCLQDTQKLLQLHNGSVVTAYSAFQRLAQKSGPPGVPVGGPPSQLPPIPANAQQMLSTVSLTEAGVPSLADIGYHDQPTSPFKVVCCGSLQPRRFMSWVHSQEVLVQHFRVSSKLYLAYTMF